MSIDFTILCTLPPDEFLQKKTRWLEWDAAKRSGRFGGMWLSCDVLRKGEDPLPKPERDWAKRVVTVLRANGRLSDDTFDDFDDWTTALAKATHGAVYSYPSGEFLYVWVDTKEEETRARIAELLIAGDFEALARWVGELVAKHAKAKRTPSPARAQLDWIVEVALPVIQAKIAAGEARPAPALLALRLAFTGTSASPQLDAMVVAAAALPDLAGDSAVQAAARQIAEARMGELAKVMPADLGELTALLDGVQREDPQSLLRFEVFLGPQPAYLARRQELIVELAASGRALPASLTRRLVQLVYHVKALRSEPGRAAFAKHGELAQAIAAHEADNEDADRIRAEHEQRYKTELVSDARARNNALHGPERRRPRLPDDIVTMISKGRDAAAVEAYRARFPGLADQAQQAVTDAKAYFGPP